MSNPIQSVYNWYRSVIRNPKYRWWVILGTLAYIFSPIDLAPDFIPILGELDDVALFAILVSEVSQIVADYLKSRNAEQATVANATQSETVDVDAIPMNESNL